MAGARFCAKCGASSSTRPAAAPAIPRLPLAAAPSGGLSTRWLIVPTAIFVFLSRQLVPIAVVAACAAGLWGVRTNPEPVAAQWPASRPYLPWAPALQTLVVFVMLGGNPIAVAVIGAAVLAALRYNRELLHALEPWWAFQESIPAALRKPLAFVVPGLCGYYFGVRAGGQEWTYTLISIAIGVVLAFLLLFTPPTSLRRTSRS